MTTKISKKQIANLHASVDELAASNPELAVALVTIFEGLMQTETAVQVPAKKGAKGKAVVEADEDDLDDDDDNGDDEDDADAEDEDGDDELDDDEEEEVAPKRGRGKSSAKASAKAPAKGRGKAKAVEVEEEDEDEDGEDAAEGVDIDDLEASTIEEAFTEADGDEKHERVSGGLKEMAAIVDDLGLDVDAIYKAAKAKVTNDKKAALVEVLNRAYSVIDAINAFELDDIIAAVAELTEEEDYKPAGRGAANKSLNASTDLFRAVMLAE